MLKKVLSIQSKSDIKYGSKPRFDLDLNMRNYIKSVLKSNRIYHYEDDYGNIYAIKGKADLYNCVVAHVDTVHDIVEDFEIRRQGYFFYAFNKMTVSQTGIGGDDKVGVYIALQTLLSRKDAVKVVFYRNEEIGRLGSEYSIKNHKDFYKDCKFIVQPDRRGHTDFITYSGGVKMISKEFKKDARKIYKIFDYKDEKGIATDVDVLVKNHVGLSCINLSSGYYRAHSSTEVVDIEIVDIAYKITNMLFDNLIKQYPHKHVPKPTTWGNSKYNYGNYGGSELFDTFKTNAEKKSVKKSDDTAESSYGLNSIVTSNNDFELFAKLEKYNYYKLMEDDHIIHMADFERRNGSPVTPSCPKCKERGTIYFIPNENEFYCISCNDFVKGIAMDKVLRKHLFIEDNNIKFYHSKAMNRWIHEKDAVWDINLGTYKVK